MIIKMTKGTLGNEWMLFKVDDFADSTAPVLVDMCDGEELGWVPTRFQVSDCGGVLGLLGIAMALAAESCEVSWDDFNCKWTECDEDGDDKFSLQELPE